MTPAEIVSLLDAASHDEAQFSTVLFELCAVKKITVPRGTRFIEPPTADNVLRRAMDGGFPRRHLVQELDLLRH